MIVATGLDRVASRDPEVLSLLEGRRVGLVAHPASVTAGLAHARGVLERAGVKLTALFGPEHGYGGEAQDMIGVGEERDADAGVPIHSLYGATEDDLAPRPEHLAGLDALVIDLQDVGSRYYTFVWTAALCLRAAAAAGVTTIVLDRPNPLGGVVMEGAPQRRGYRSFVGLYDVPVRHAMTLGEIAMMVRELEGLDPAMLTVVPMLGWKREMQWEDCGLPWVLPSPNMPTPDTARIYPGGCLLEGTSLNEGRGTTRPFEIFGAPSVDGAGLAATIAAEGVTLRPLTFQPTFHKHGGQVCGGVQVHVTDRHAVRSYALYVQILAALRARSPEAFQWRTDAYEFVHDRPAIDLLTGGPEIREAIDRGVPVGPVLDAGLPALTRFAADRRGWLLYEL